MKMTLLSRGSSSSRLRSHGPLPVEIHDHICIWTGHSVSFDIPAVQTNKVTIVVEIIQKSSDAGGAVWVEEDLADRIRVRVGEDYSLDNSPMTSPEPQRTATFFTEETDTETDMESGNVYPPGQAYVKEYQGRLHNRLGGVRRCLGRIVLGKEAMTLEGRDHWVEALENSRIELMFWHKLL